MSYKSTFILVAPDSEIRQAIHPDGSKDKKPMHAIQYELLTERPYAYNHEELTFEVYVRHKAIPEEERTQALWDELFRKGHPCMRASTLTKTLGWGAHYDENGKIAIYPVESPEYARFANDDSGDVRLLHAMRKNRPTKI